MNHRISFDSLWGRGTTCTANTLSCLVAHGFGSSRLEVATGCCNHGYIVEVRTQYAEGCGVWVLLSYRLPREPSTPRIALWRKLKKLGVAQMSDGVVALPDDARSREHLEWLADEVQEWGGEAGVWMATPTSRSQEMALIEQMTAARAAEYTDLAEQAHAAAAAAAADGTRTVRRLRAQWRQITRRDYFPPAERDRARAALQQLSDGAPTDVEGAVR